MTNYTPPKANIKNYGTALITGAGRRIGAAFSRSLHAQGFNVALHCLHSLSDAETLAKSLNALRPDSAKVFQADLADKTALSELSEAVLSFGGALSLLVNNASLFDKDEGLDRDRLFHTNVRAPYLLSHLFQSALSKASGSIINIADIYGETPLEGYDIYCMSKAALLMQTKSLALKFAPNIRVNAILPGVIAWPEGDNTMSKALKDKELAQIPLKRIGGYEPMVKALLYLVENDFVTGTKLVVDGGRHC